MRVRSPSCSFRSPLSCKKPPVFAYLPISSRHGLQPVSPGCTRHRLGGCIGMHLGHSWRRTAEGYHGELPGCLYCVVFVTIIITHPTITSTGPPRPIERSQQEGVRFLQYLAAYVYRLSVLLVVFFIIFLFFPNSDGIWRFTQYFGTRSPSQASTRLHRTCWRQFLLTKRELWRTNEWATKTISLKSLYKTYFFDLWLLPA